MKLHGHVITAVFRRNFISYFSNPIGYLFITAFVLASAYFEFWHENLFFTQNMADLAPLSAYFPMLLLFFIPAITMTIWAEERKAGTEELLLTLPASDLEIVLGKYFSSLAIYTVALLFSVTNIVGLRLLGDPDLGLMFSTYLGYWLMGAALLAAGMVASLLTSNISVAFILGFGICVLLILPHLFNGLTQVGGRARAILDAFGIVPHFEPFAAGLVSLGSVLYFAGIIVVMLYLNMVLLERRHWGGSEQSTLRWGHYLTRATGLLIAAVSLTVLAGRSQAILSADVTAEQVHSLSPQTTEILHQIDPKRPVLIEAFISASVPKDYIETRRNLIDLLRQYDAIGGSGIQLDLYADIRPSSEEARNAQRVYQIAPQPVTTMDDGRIGREEIFLGVVFKAGLNEETISFFYPGTPIEYELTRMIRTVAEKEKRKVGVLTTDAGLFGQFNMQMMQPGRDWLIVEDLKKQYDVTQVAPDAAIDQTFDVLIVPMASSLTQTQMNNLADYIKAGRPTLILDDPMPYMNPQLAAREPKPRPGGQQNMFMQQQQPPIPKGNLRGLTDLLHIGFDTGSIVWQDWNPHPQFRDLPPEFVFIGKGSGVAGFNEDQIVSSGLQEAITIYPGALQQKLGAGPDFTPLLTTGQLTGTTPFDRVFSNTMFGRMPNPNPPRRPTEAEYVLAAYIHGQVSEVKSALDAHAAGDAGKDAAKSEVNVIFIADIDLISDQFFELRNRGNESLRFDNVTFVLNCVDFLAGDDSFVALRKKRPQRRTLVRFAEMTEAVQKRARQEKKVAEEEAEGKLDGAQKTLDEQVAAIEKQTDIDPRTKEMRIENVRRTLQRELDVEKTRIEAAKQVRIGAINAELSRDVRSTQNWIKFLAVAIPPIPALVIAIAVFFARVKGEKEGVDPKRLV